MSWVAIGVGVGSMIVGGVSGALGSGKKPKIPAPPTLNPDAIQMDTLRGNLKALPEIQNLTGKVNTFNIQELERALELALPGGSSKVKANILDQLEGKMDTADTQAVIRNATAAGFGSGIQGGGIGRNLVLRDLGRSVVDTKERGLTNFMNFQQANRAVLFNPASMFLTPAQRLEAQAANNRMIYDAAVAQAGIDAQPSQGQAALSGALGSLSSMGGTFAGMSFGSGFGGGAATSAGGWTTPSMPRSSSGSLNTPGRFRFPGTQYGGGWI